jgi:8-hydroxy-5-deazaflavin:NADPH oxidoreductase
VTVGFIGGTGPEARGLALRFVRAGIEVVLGSRTPDRAARAAAECRSRLGTMDVRGALNREMLPECEVVFLTVPWEQATGAVDTLRAEFRPGQVLVDVTVPLRFAAGTPERVELAEGSNAERIAKHVPEGIELVGAFKTEPAHVLGEIDLPLDCDTFVCGDSAAAKMKVMDIAARVPGLRPLDAGPLVAARTLEMMTVLAIQLNRSHRSKGGRFRIVGL